MNSLVLMILSLVTLIAGTSQALAQDIYLDAPQLIPKAELTLSPRSGSFVDGSTFEVPILLNTRGSSVNGVEVRITFDRERLEVIKPSSGLSIIGIWVEPPVYDNARGTASYVGVIPNGITTNSGIVGSITFKAKKTGRAAVSIGTNSKVLLNDGYGSRAIVDLGRAEYSIVPKAPNGVVIFSDTHPLQDEWYNNNSPIISWERDAGVSGFSYTLDDKPSTVPPNEINTNETTTAFENLNDGLWYFHIKAYKNGVWGTTGHFLVRVDTHFPAEFEPGIDYLFSDDTSFDRALVSFFTTDNLSGILNYEVGVIDANHPVTTSPVFVHAESPFQVPLGNNELNVIVRAVDKAGNIQDISIVVGPPSFLQEFIKDNLVYILLLIILIGLVGLILHYLVGHHILRTLRKAAEIIRKEDRAVESGIIHGNQDVPVQ